MADEKHGTPHHAAPAAAPKAHPLVGEARKLQDDAEAAHKKHNEALEGLRERLDEVADKATGEHLSASARASIEGALTEAESAINRAKTTSVPLS